MKLVFVGPAPIHSALSNIQPEWDFQSPIETLDEFYEEMQKEEGSKIASDTSAIIIFSRLFNSDRKKFAEAVAFYAPHASVSILIPSQDRTTDEEIINYEIRQAQNLKGLNIEGAPYSYILYESPGPDLFQALVEYASSVTGGLAAKRIIRESLPDKYFESVSDPLNDFEKFDDTDDDEEVYLPESKGAGKVIAVTSSKGGSGKSTVSILLGTYLAQASEISEQLGLENRKLKVCLVDLDTRDGQLGFLNKASKPTIVNIVEENANLGEHSEVSEQAIAKGIFSSPNLKADFIFAAKRPRYAKNVSPNFYAAVVQKLREMYDIVILDTSVNYTDDLLEKVAYPLADQILFVTDMGISSIYGMARWIKETTMSKETGSAGIDKNKIAVIVNKALTNVEITEENIENAALGIPVIAFLPSVPELITYAANTNQLNDVFGHPYFNEVFKDLAETVIGDSYKLGEIPPR